MTAQEIFEKADALQDQLDAITQRLGRARRRKMVSFKINEISAVDRPAQQEALARVIKTGDTTLTYQTGAEIEEAEKRQSAEAALDRLAAKSRRSGPMPETSHAPAVTFEAKVSEIQKAAGCSRTQAMRQAADRYPELLAASRSVGTSTPTSPAVAKAVATRRAFDERVREIATRDKIPTTAAMRKAVTEFPAEFEAMQNAGAAHNRSAR